MADNDEVKHSTQISGNNISNNLINGPGEIKFTHKVGDVEIPNSIVISQEYFQQDPITIKLTSPLTTIKIGDSVKLEFDITSGYPNSFAVILSVEGDDNSKYHILAERILYNFIDKKSSITFAVPDSPSKDCYIKIVGLDENDKVIAISNSSNKFEIVSPITNATLTINPIKKIVQTEDEITIIFELKPPQVEVDFFLIALNIDGNLYNPSRQVIKDSKVRSFLFRIPNQPGKICQLGIIAIKSGSKIVSGISNNFEIKSKGLNPPVNPEFNLISPKNTDDLHVDDTINIQFELIPSSFITPNLEISSSINNKDFTKIIDLNHFYGNRTISFKIPRCKQFWLRFNAQSVIEKTFGPFTIGNRLVVSVLVDKLKEHLDSMDNILAKIRLPPGKSRFSGKIDVGVFLYYLITTNEVDKYFTTLKKLEELETVFEDTLVKSKISEDLLNPFKTNLQELRNFRAKFSGLENKAEVKKNLMSLLVLFKKAINEPNLLQQFKDQQKVQTLKKLNPSEIINNVIYLSWIMEHTSEIDTITSRQLGYESLFKFAQLYEFLKKSITELFKMHEKLQETRKIVKGITKSLKSQ